MFEEKPDWKSSLKKSFSGIFSKFKRQKNDEIINSTSDEDKTNFYSASTPSSSATPYQLTEESQDSGAPPLSIESSKNPQKVSEKISSLLKQDWRSKFTPKIPQRLSKSGVSALAIPGRPSIQWNSRTLAFIALLIAVLWVTFQLSGLFSTLVEKYIPEMSSRSFGGSQEFVRKFKSLSEYQVVINRNLFSSRNLIPGDGDVAPTNAPVKTNLPINLIGTVILNNELKSVASIEDRNDKQVYPVRVDDEIPGKLKVESIEAYKVVFVNLMNNRREFVEMPEEFQGASLSVENTPTGKKPTKAGSGVGSSIEQVSGNQFNIPRAEVDKAFQDMNSILTQARAIPHTENGQPAGYKLIQIVPGSIYEKLGMQNEDVIKGINGDPINDPGKAFELMNQLKTASRMELSIQRGGKVMNFTYDFR